MRKAKRSRRVSLFLSASLLLASLPFGEGRASATDNTDTVTNSIPLSVSEDSQNAIAAEEVLFSKPGNLKETTTEHQISATWDAVEGAQSYTMTVDENIVYNGPEPSFIYKSAFPNTEYEIAVWANDHAGTPSEQSILTVKTKEMLTPSNPMNFRVTTDETSLTVRWEPAERATSYVVAVNDQEVYRGNDLSYTYTGLTPKTRYAVEIWSVNEHGISGKQLNTVNTKDPDKLPAPTNLKVESTSNSITLSWDPVEGANTYLVQEKNDLVYQGPNTTFTLENLNPGQPYFFYVYGRNNSSNITVEGEPGRITGVTKRLPAPTNFAAIPKSTSVHLSWDPVENTNAVEYYLKRGKKIIYEGPLTTFIDTGLQEGETYNYTLTALVDHTYSNQAETNTTTLIAKLPYPANFRVTNLKYNKVSLEWDAVEGADEYVITRNGRTIGIPMDTSWEDTVDIDFSGSTFTYRVAAIKNGVSGKEAMKVVTVPKEPVPGEVPSGTFELKADRIYHDTVDLSWNQVTGATYYDVYQDETNKVWSGTLNTLTVGNVGPEESHTFKVVAGNESGTIESNIISVKTPSAPQNIVITPAQPKKGTITFDFKVIDGAVMYVERNPQTKYTPVGDGTYRKSYVNSATGESHNDVIVSPVNGKLNFAETDVDPNRKYNYAIVAAVKNAEGTETVVAKEEISVHTPADGSGATVPGTIVDPGTGGGTTPTEPGTGGGNTPTPDPGTGSGGGTTPTTPTTPGTDGADNNTVTVPGSIGDNDAEIIPEEGTTSFSDIDKSYAKEAILYLASKGIVKGYPDGTFGIKKKVTRAEFAIFLNRALGYTLSSPYAGNFKDIDPQAWYASELNSAISNDIAKGFNDNTYRPNLVISREQAASMLSNVLVKNGSSLSSEVQYEDQENIASWAKESVALVTQESVMKGYPGNKFMPKRSLSREETAQLIYHLIKKIK